MHGEPGTGTELIEAEARAVARMLSRGWWLYLVTGVLWLVFGWVVLSARSEITTVWAVAVYAGILFLLVGVGQLVVAAVAESWNWLHAAFGVLALLAAVAAFAWPGPTFVTLAAVLAWYLLFDGVFLLVGAFYDRHVVDHWWIFALLGVAEVAVAFWALSYPGRSILLLIVWVGFTALFKGVTNIVAAFTIRSLPQEVDRALG
jgi:uncharacterized membrane protein HdeD (DUF308 family)